MKLVELILKFLVALARASARSNRRADGISSMTTSNAPTEPIDPKIATAAQLRHRMGEIILGYEARRDANGNLAIYKLPAGDGGGSFEIAGINNRYHPEEAAKLAKLIRDGDPKGAEREAADYFAAYTDAVDAWSTSPALDFWNRDCCFNRGPGGAAAILQIALRVGVDAKVGPKTLGALRARERGDLGGLLVDLRAAREEYERRKFPWKPHARDESSKFWKGLVNRWDHALTDAHSFLWKPKPIPNARREAQQAGEPGAPWVDVAAALIGTKEFAGGKDNPTILAWAAAVCHKYPDLKGYVGWYDHDSIPWCALFIAYDLTVTGHKPPRKALGAGNYVDAWTDGVRLSGPAIGAIMVKRRKGGHHVALYMGEDDDDYFCLGGNQSDAVNIARISKHADWRGFMWPKDAPPPARIGPVRRTFAQAREATEA